ncbi:PREDICTED: probable G-protein coupled receptor 62 [Bison bison bison]|uniref:Probable G-protein coupled receptor 62 n=1 Tax=Bison bison bison TaxID=43346 RepID=A0A6P3IH75_BISBB|nr:PREDICTED: probable G-protein coupled receptor 62 [Bison bison bison]
MGCILAALVEAAALLGNGALLVVVLRTPGLRDALYLVHLPLRPRPPWGKAALAPALAVGQFAACWLPYGCACLAPAAQAAAAEAAVTWIAYSAFAAHPFLYGLLQRPVRRTLGRLARRVLPWSPRACTSRAWHPRALLQHLQRPPEGPALGPSEAPDQGRDLTERESLSMSEAT